MIKAIAGYGYFDELVVPIIENTAWEHELADSLGDCIRRNPKAVAVLVRRHGMYVWGATWEQAKRHGEGLHYLFEVAVNLRRLGVIDLCAPPASVTVSNGLKRPRIAEQPNGNHTAYKYVLFDIEGTTTPIAFVKETLFPYASTHAEAYLSRNWTETSHLKDIEELSSLAGGSKSTQSPASLAQFVRKLIAEDSKASALKSLQGRMWEEAYTSGAITGQVFDDVPVVFAKLTSSGSRVGIYSSGSRRAQQLLFKYSTHGDLSQFISCYFDTTSGPKREAASYSEILLSIGQVPGDVLFVTDIPQEADAAKAAGMSVKIAVRPGNDPLHAGITAETVTSFLDL
jgi:methylthioribulose 1-phosphate dehydratase/enolase-phosphatase E1